MKVQVNGYGISNSVGSEFFNVNSIKHERYVPQEIKWEIKELETKKLYFSLMLNSMILLLHLQPKQALQNWSENIVYQIYEDLDWSS